MAKKPKHTKLVVPGINTGGKSQPPPQPPKKPKGQKEHQPPESGQDNTVALPTGVSGAAIRAKVKWRKRRKRVIRLGTLALVFVLILFVYFSGLYRTAVLRGGEWVEGLRLSFTSGSGLPLGFEIPGYRQALPLGSSAVAVLGDKDLVVLSTKGSELYRVQHGFANPHITTSRTRVCVYNRGGTSYVVEGRDKRVLSRTAPGEIVFAELSEDGALALVTTSGYASTLEVYASVTDDSYRLRWPISKGNPYQATFMSDSRYLALACLDTTDGALGTTIYLLKTSEEDVQAEIHAYGALALDMQYLSSGRLLVVYDTYCATYNSKGEELARYSYGERRLSTAEITTNGAVLAFSSSGSQQDIVSLDADMQLSCRFSIDSTQTPGIMVYSGNIYLLSGRSVYAFDKEGALRKSWELDSDGYTLVNAGLPVLLRSGYMEDIHWMLDEDGAPPDKQGSGLVNSETGTETQPQSGENAPESAGLQDQTQPEDEPSADT